MNWNIDQGHPAVAHSEQVGEFASRFLSYHGLSHFQYSRCFYDGSIWVLSNRRDLWETFSRFGFSVLSSFEPRYEGETSYVFFWDESLPSFPVQVVRERNKMFHGVTLVRRHKEYYDMIGFAMSSTRSNIMTYYYNHLSEFEDFAKGFLAARSDLVKVQERNKIIPPQSLMDPNREKIVLPQESSRFAIQGKDRPTYITSQEMFCLKLLGKGKTLKEISDHLSVSSRTIETYLKRLKVRTGFKTNEQAIQAIACRF